MRAANSYRYERRGVLAIEPRAFADLFFAMSSAPENIEIGDAVIVDIVGPLDQHSGGFCDSYDAIIERVEAACATAARGRP